MYENIGGQIKKIAKVIYIIGIIASVVTGVGVMTLYKFYMGLAVIALGALISWVISIILYGFGELIECFHNIENKLSQQDG